LKEYSEEKQAFFHQLKMRVIKLGDFKLPEGVVSEGAAAGAQVNSAAALVLQEEKGGGDLPEGEQSPSDAALARRLSIGEEDALLARRLSEEEDAMLARRLSQGETNKVDGDEALAKKLQAEEQAKMRKLAAKKDQCIVL